MSDILDAFIARFHRDGWIAAGPPSAGVTIAMVNEIARLRAELADVLAENDAVRFVSNNLRAEVAALRAQRCDCDEPPGIGLGTRGA